VSTDQYRAAKVQALLEERAGYVARDLPDRVAAVDEQLRLLGTTGAPPAKRATTRSKKAK
jgi:hypothetical protein